MSGLFDALTARFVQGADPQVRLRPKARFEQPADLSTDLEEESLERPAPRPVSSEAREHTVATSLTSPPPDERPALTPPLQTQSAEPPVSNGLETIEEVEPTPPRWDEGEGLEAQPATTQPAAPPATTDPANPRQLEPQAEASPPETQILHERIEVHQEFVRTESATPPSPSRITAQPAQLTPMDHAQEQAQPRQAPLEPPTGTTVKIGRIEVKAPPKPAAPAPKPPPSPPRRPAADRGRTQSSKLTTYLGWKS